MDYIETFKNLKTNNKWGRKSPHKAVLMLTVIELYEKNILMDNAIRYDETLISTFLKMWNTVLPNEPLFHPDAYLPFWYLQSDNFWHIVPIRGKEDILSLMRDTNIKPSEAKLIDSVKYAELDEDLHFLMTLPSGRSSLKRALLETYTDLTEEQIDSLTENIDNAVDYSVSAIADYEKILLQGKEELQEEILENDNELIHQFQKLNEDLQIVLNIQYFSFLKSHRNERYMFKEIFPTVYDLFDKIVNHPIKQGDISPLFVLIYDSFLSDLKFSLMSEEGALEIIDKIGEAIDVLHENNKVEKIITTPKEAIEEALQTEKICQVESPSEDIDIPVQNIIQGENFVLENRKGKYWTKDEEEQIEKYFQQGKDASTIAAIIGRTENAVKIRLAKLGLIEYIYGQEDCVILPVSDRVEKSQSLDDFKIENTFSRAYILNNHGEKIFSTDGKLKYLCRKLYRLNLKDACFTIKSMRYNSGVWMKGVKKIVAYPNTELYKVMVNTIDYSEIVKDIVDSPIFEECKLKVKDEWYDYKGELASETVKNSTVPDYNLQQVNNKIIENPLYENRKQAVLRALGYFRLPAKIRDIARTISRTAWGTTIKEEDVEEIINTLTEVDFIDGKYILRSKR